MTAVTQILRSLTAAALGKRKYHFSYKSLQKSNGNPLGHMPVSQPITVARSGTGGMQDVDWIRPVSSAVFLVSVPPESCEHIWEEREV